MAEDPSNSERLRAEQEALKNCESEPLHDIGYIQPCGYLLAYDLGDDCVMAASENCVDWFARPLDKLLGADLVDVLPSEIVHRCNNARAHSTIETQREFLGRVTSGDAACEVFGHIKQQSFILELQPIMGDSNDSEMKLLDTVHRILARLRTLDSEQLVLEHAVEELRAISRFHRVKAYRFLSDGTGEVVAESREPHMASFLGLRYPASDIPKAARRLYASTPIRALADISASQVRIVKREPSQAPIDLSLAVLRGVVPVHALYMKNMGVRATVSLPVTINGKMSGLFALHHSTERALDSRVLSALELLGSSISLMLNALVQHQRNARIRQCGRLAASLFVPDDSRQGFSVFLASTGADLASLLDADGVALLGDDRYDAFGHCPKEDCVRKLAELIDRDYLEEAGHEEPIALDAIVAAYPTLDLDGVAGLLALPRPAIGHRYLFFFRRDIGRNIRWAGRPDKEIVKSPSGFRLNPRASFAEYIDKRHATSDPFLREDIVVAEALSAAFANTMSGVAVQSQHRERLGLVIRELNHRVRNTLALVGSIVSQSRDHADSIGDFVLALQDRLHALSETQKLLTQYEWRAINMRTLVERALLPYREYLGSRLVLHGSPCALPAPLASLFALVINELASNATKHGALSVSSGRIQVEWKHSDQVLVFSWKESGGPLVKEPTRSGFGKQLIEEALVYEFNADCRLRFLPAGVEATFSVPLDKLTFNTEEPDVELVVAPVTAPREFVALLLEDDYIISKEMTRLLKSLGASRVDAVPSLEAARDCIASSDYDIAVLDANIRGEFSGEIATLLDAKEVPVVFATGYGSKERRLHELPCVEVLSKPVTRSQLYSVLRTVNLGSDE